MKWKARRVSPKTIFSKVSVQAVFGMIIAVSSIVDAQGLPKESILPLSFAEKAAVAAMDKCVEGGYKVSVAVVDVAGRSLCYYGTTEPALILWIAVPEKRIRLLVFVGPLNIWLNSLQNFLVSKVSAT